MIGWIASPIMVMSGLLLRSKLCTPFLWTTSFNSVVVKRSARIKLHHVDTSTLPLRATTRLCDDGESDIFLAKNAFDVLARKSKSWQRLGTIVDLSLDESYSHPYNQTLKSVCDVGTDHGLLATGLAMTNRFDHVLGVDKSNQALRDGAWKLQDDILAYRNKRTSVVDDDNKLNVEFRLSDGLQNVHAGEADVVCVAGMGVHTMVDILTERNIGILPSEQRQLLLDKLGTQRILVQPTNSRPRLLMHLYTCLHDIGWRVRIERVNYVSSRWYFTAEFERSGSSVLQIPGAIAKASDATVDWVTHHRKWIHLDSVKTGVTNRNDVLWLNVFDIPT